MDFACHYCWSCFWSDSYFCMLDLVAKYGLILKYTKFSIKKNMTVIYSQHVMPLSFIHHGKLAFHLIIFPSPTIWKSAENDVISSERKGGTDSENCLRFASFVTLVWQPLLCTYFSREKLHSNVTCIYVLLTIVIESNILLRFSFHFFLNYDRASILEL